MRVGACQECESLERVIGCCAGLYAPNMPAPAPTSVSLGDKVGVWPFLHPKYYPAFSEADDAPRDRSDSGVICDFREDTPVALS